MRALGRPPDDDSILRDEIVRQRLRIPSACTAPPAMQRASRVSTLPLSLLKLREASAPEAPGESRPLCRSPTVVPH
jgi:hypothetical protein